MFAFFLEYFPTFINIIFHVVCHADSRFAVIIEKYLGVWVMKFHIVKRIHYFFIGFAEVCPLPECTPILYHCFQIYFCKLISIPLRYTVFFLYLYFCIKILNNSRHVVVMKVYSIRFHKISIKVVVNVFIYFWWGKVDGAVSRSLQ